MSASPATRRAVAEIDFGEGKDALFKIGNRSIHQFWHLFSAHFRNVLLAPQRRPDSGRVSWTWREAIEKPPVTAAELTELRRRLTEANRSLAGSFGALVRKDQIPGGGATLDGQVRANVREMVTQLMAMRDLALSGFVCRTDAGLMLHSWGAADAAQPYYPDTQAGEISGAVSAAGEQLGGVTVVLENAQGGSIARLKTDAEGRFSFPKVAPGNYRIRVIDRSDFPGNGLAVTMEREAITGLELRSVSTESISGRAPELSGLESSIPWYKRRLTAVVGLLLVLGIGGCVWRSTRPQAVTTVATNQSSGWQSAKGQLAANGDSKNSSIDERKVGEEGAFSTLANTLSSPKLSAARPVPALSDARDSATNRAIAPRDGSPDSFRPAPEDKNSKPDSANNAAPRDALKAQNKSPESRTAIPGNPSEAVSPAEDPAGAKPGDDQPKTAEDKRAKLSSEAAVKKRPAGSGATSSNTDESLAETIPSGGPKTSPDSAASGSASGHGSKSPKAAMTKSPAATGNKSESPAADGDANTDAAQAPATRADAPASGQAKLAAEKNRKGPAKTATAIGGAISPAESAGPSAGEDTQNEPPAAKSAANKNAPKSVRPGKTPAVQPPSQLESAAQPPQDNPAESEAPATSAATKEPAKQSASAPGKSPISIKPPDDPHASTDEPETVQPAATSAAAAANSDSPRGRAKSARKKPASADSLQNQDEASPPGSSADLPVTIAAHSTLASGAQDGAPLIQSRRVHASTWKPRIVQDVIVPTQPVTAAEEDAMETLRAELLQERATRMPVEFQRPQMRSGFVVEFSGSGSGQELPRWRNETGTELTGSSVRDQHAELEWTGPVPAASTSYALGYADGRIIAAVSIDPSGVPVLRVSPEVRASYWFGIERAPSVKATSTTPQQSTGFEWRLLSGASIPTSWLRDDHWLGHGQRVEIPLDSTAARVGNYAIALIDQSTGWALVGNITVQ